MITLLNLTNKINKYPNIQIILNRKEIISLNLQKLKVKVK